MPTIKPPTEARKFVHNNASPVVSPADVQVAIMPALENYYEVISDIIDDVFTVEDLDIEGGLTVGGNADIGDTLLVDTITEHTAGAGVTADGVLLKDSQVTTDVINEKTAASGVTADSVLLKDGTVKTAAGSVSSVALKLNDDNTGIISRGTNEVGIVTDGTDGWGQNASQAWIPSIDNTCDIGNILVNPRAIYSSQTIVQKGIANEGYGQLRLLTISSLVVLNGASTVLPMQIPSGAKLIGINLRVDSAITFGGGGATWSAAYSTGATQSIATGVAPDKNTMVNKFFNVNAATDILSANTNVTITPNAGTFSTGTVTGVAYYYVLSSLTDVA